MREQQMSEKIGKSAKEKIIDTISSFFDERDERREYVTPNEFM